MPLEFALRPQFDLARSSSRKRKRPWRFARLALSVATYWLAIAGATHAFIASTKERPARAHQAPPLEQRADDEVPPTPLAIPAEPSLMQPGVEPEPPSAQDSAPALPPGPAPEPRMEPAPPIAALRAPTFLAPATLRATTHPTIAVPARPAASLPPPPRSGGIAHTGPRIEDPLAALADPEPRRNEAAVAPVPPQPERDALPAVSLPSCETAAASAEQSVDFHASSTTPDLPREAFAAVLDRGGYLARCAIPARTALDICAAIQDGRVVGVSVSSKPRTASIDACVRRAVAGLRFPKSPRLDVARTRFDTAR